MRRLPAEFEQQSFVQLIFPHTKSDWVPYLKEASATFVQIAHAIARFEPCLIICDDIERVRSYFGAYDNLYFIQYQSDDTWARDCSGITVEIDKKATILDFTFNGWGGKFDSEHDNAMTSAISFSYDSAIQKINFVLEGGGIESNGDGALLTTSQCLQNSNRNGTFSSKEIERELKKQFDLHTVHWLHHGYLAGDDTDSHIDTLARFIDTNTIMYLQCQDKNDEHFESLSLMEEELKALQNKAGKPYGLIALPMSEAIYFEGERLPATYANFLMVNGAVLVPTYRDPKDEKVLEIFRTTFPKKEIIGIDCSILIRQHGSLHCVTMQFPVSVRLT